MNDYSKSVVLACVIAMGLGGCSAAREGMEAHQDAVARVDGHSLSVEHAAQLLSVADEELAPNNPLIVDPFSDLWIGYTILATELASPDTFSNIDVTPIIQHTLDQELVWQLRDSEILAQVAPSDAELRQAYDREQPYTRVEVQQILIDVPTSGSSEEVDSLRRFAEDLRERAAAGEDFAELARRYSTDSTTAANGGAVGWISRGRFYPEVEDVVLHMQPGDISETVRSRRGYHILKVIDRDALEFEEVEQEFRRNYIAERLPGLEKAYIDSLEQAARVEFTPNAVRLVRQLAFAPRLERLPAAQASAVLARFRGGELTLGEWAAFVIRGSSDGRRAFTQDSVKVAEYLMGLVRNKLLVKAANDLNYSVPQATVDSLTDAARRDLFTAAATVGLRRDPLVSGEWTVPQAVDAALELLLARRLSPASLEKVELALRQGHAIQFYPDRSRAVIARLTAIRQSAGGAGEAGSE
ncbi:MAG: peptidylprolyl isomerase [Gemmatimonadales bacterium]|jgi:hypothetical protein